MPYTNVWGNSFTQIFEEIPLLSYVYTSYEKNYPTQLFGDVIQDTWPHVPLGLSVIYLIGIVVGQKVMASRPPMKLKYLLTAWNASLSLFSLCGALRTVSQLLFNLSTIPLRDTICLPAKHTAWGNNATGLWVQLFIYSKAPELIDTVFLVLRKRKVIFLHWYHHVTVLLFCWHSFVTEAPNALYFVAMNFSVHAIMYGYYACASLKIPFPLPPWAITAAQISQMAVGVTVQVSSTLLYYQQTPEMPCAVNFHNIMAGALMYGSYLFLFVAFAVDRFILPKRKGIAARVATVTAQEKGIPASITKSHMQRATSNASLNGDKDKSA